MKSITRNSVHYEIIKLSVGDLRKGMFVCELDRPWAETPFLFEGFVIETDADLDVVTQYCGHVYIDLGRTEVMRVKTDTISKHSSAPGKHRNSLIKEMESAETTQHKTSNLVKTFQDEIRFGNSVDVVLAKSAVSQCVASILRNPDAMMFMSQMKDKNHNLSAHAFNVCIYSIILGRFAGLEAKQLEELGTCGLLHDIGDIEIPDALLNKKGALSEEEFAIIKRHTTYGRDILMSARNIHAGAVDVAHAHHECPDGSGYPRGLVENQINQSTRIVAVVDKYAAITSNASYRTAQNHMEAINIMNLLAETRKIDKPLCSAFATYLGFYPPGTIVELSSGEVALVVKSNLQNRLRPQVLVVRDMEGNPVEWFVDLAVKSIDGKGKAYKIKMVHLPGYLGIDLSRYQNILIQAYD